jgi:predicted Rdx family selenoprotein
LAAEIESKLGLSPTLVRSHGGVFEVTFGEDLVFSKRGLGRFPEPGEVEGELQKRLASDP